MSGTRNHDAARKAFRNRIVGLRFVRASDLRPNPRNWRKHPPAQRKILRKLLADIGFAHALVARERDGELELLDGHLRSDVAGDQEVPVLVVDLSDEEAATLLAALDPLGAMVEADQERLDALLAQSKILADEAYSELLQLLPSTLVDLGQPPAEVMENIEELERVKEYRRRGKRLVKERADSERFLVLAYRSRAEKERALRELGLPPDERYVPAELVELRKRPRAVLAHESHGRSPDVRHADITR